MQQPSLYFKEQSSERKFGINFGLTLSPKWAKFVFAKDEGNIQLFCFSSVFAFKQAKEHILIQVQPQNYKWQNGKDCKGRWIGHNRI